MLENLDIVAISALLPITAAMLVTHVNPYHALIIRGIVGAVAALVYALFGAADVALTEALVGTMLSIMLYAIAVRSSMSLRLGVLATPSATPAQPEATAAPSMAQQLFPALRQVLQKHHLRLEVCPYDSPQALQFALENKEIHAVCVAISQFSAASPPADLAAPYALSVRIPRLYEILAAAMSPEIATVGFSRALRLMPSEQSSSPTYLQKALEG